jgi:hypothetical protein
MVSQPSFSAPKALKPTAKVFRQATTINSVTVSWTDPRKATADSNTRYVVQVSIKVGKKWTVQEQFSTADNTHTFTGLDQNTSYRITVTAINANGEEGKNKKGTKVTSVVNITAKTLKYTAVKIKKPVKYTNTDGASMVEATITQPNKKPAGASYDNYALYTVTGSGKNAIVFFFFVESYKVENGILTIDWSKLNLSDTVKHKFVLRAVTGNVESVDAKFTIKYSALKMKVL